MNAEEYTELRLDDQIDWYDTKSQENQTAFKTLRRSEIVAAAFIPLASGLTASIPSMTLLLTLSTGLLGISIAIAAGLLALSQHQERWIEFRTTCENLKKEKYMFLTGVDPYEGKDAYKVLVQRVESLVSKENTNWAKYMMRPEEGKSTKKG